MFTAESLKKIATGFFCGVAFMFVLSLDLPFVGGKAPSVYASKESEIASIKRTEWIPANLLTIIFGDVSDLRKLFDEKNHLPAIEAFRKQYPVNEKTSEINGVYVETFTPVGGVPAKNRDKVLINLHGGGFIVGARTLGRLESIPVASVAGMKVVSVDYRQGPEHRFPAASEDVSKVYQHLLKTYQPENIGIYGCSAGGMLTAQALAWFDKYGQPFPGAVGIFCAGTDGIGEGDSAVIAEAFGTNLPAAEIAYFKGADRNSALFAPYYHDELMAKFPDTLLISSTRDMALSSVLATHQKLLKLERFSELHVFEGMDHAFFANDPGVPETDLAIKIIADFFNANLGVAE